MISYLHPEILKYINQEKIKTIIELGARGGDEAVALAEHYTNAIVHTFECNPNILDRTKSTIKANSRVILHEIAVSDVEEDIDFYPINDVNPGASSFFKPVDGTLGSDCVLLDPVKLKTKRLDSYLEQKNINSVDLICADIQGYEIKAFTGMGDLFKQVTYIISEMPIQNETYIGAPNKIDFVQFMLNNGFTPKIATQENFFELNVLFERQI
jgi:FkbM family methyltransferase